MLPRTNAALVVLLLVACACACASHVDAPKSGAAVIAFTVTDFQGSYRFTVYEDGRAEYASVPGPSWQNVQTLESRATRDEVKYVARVLKENDFCALVSTERPGIPDEARPKFDVHLDGMACSVTMWDGEYRDNPKARVSLAAVEDLGRSIKGRARQ